MTTKTRTLRTPAEKAIAALGVEQRRVEKLHEKRDRLRSEVDDVEDELDAAVERLEYLKANPDLPEADAEPIPGVDGAA